MALDLQAAFEKFSDEYIRFERVANKRSNRPDIHAFLLLDELQPTENSRDMVGGASHDEIYLGVDVDQLSEVITEEQVCELRRCGVRYSTEHDCLVMFV